MLVLANFDWEGFLICLPLLMAVPLIGDAVARLLRRSRANPTR